MNYGDEALYAGLPNSAKRMDGWAAYGTLEAPSPTNSSPNKEVRMQVNFPESADYTIEFAVSVPGNFSQNQVRLNVEAFITWAVEGGFISRRVTVANGTTITGVAQGATVVVRDASGSLVGIDPPGSVFTYGVSMQIAKGSRATSGTPPTYSPIGVVEQSAAATAGTPIVNFNIPSDAGVNSVMVLAYRTNGANYFPIADGDIRIEQQCQNQVVASYLYGDQRGKFVPLQPGTTRLAVVANATFAAPNEYHVTVIFGVDG